jgi:hypothetical protein
MNRRILTALFGAVWVSGCSSTAKADFAQSACAPDSARFARTVRDDLGRFGVRVPSEGLPLEIKQHSVAPVISDRVLITASWGGPLDGAILWSDCSGTAVHGESSGYVLAVGHRVLGTERFLLQLRAITGTGSGWRRESTSLYLAHPEKLTLVWTGVVAERSYQSASVGAYELEGLLSYVDEDSLVHTSARYTVGLSADGLWTRANDSAERRSDVYLWNPRTQKYEQRNRRP